MTAFSDYLEGQLINHIFRTASFTKPTTIAIALVTSAITDADTGATIAEVANANNYSRVSLNPLDTNWAAPVAGNGVTSNLVAINFPQATGSWGTVTGVAILDSATYGAGNLLFYGTLAVNKTINNGDTFTFPINGLSVTLA
jgi:hypothetical protein